VFYPNPKPYLHHDFILHMISYRTKRSHAWSQINRIFSRVVFLERKLVVLIFSSLFMWGGIPPVENDFERKSQRKNHLKMGFPLPTVIYPAENYLVRRFLSSISFIDRELFCFPPIFSFLLSSDLWSGILPFFSFHFFLFFLFISPFPYLSFRIRVLAFVICSPLRRFCCPFLRGKGWGFFS